MIDKILVAIDVQNDFVTGTLANEEAQKAIPEIVKRVKEFGDSGCPVVFTKDSHDDDLYLGSQEGRKLPVKHCIWCTEGQDIVKEVLDATNRKNILMIMGKETFGSIELGEYFRDDLSSRNKYKNIKKIYIVGFCTDICVITNALILKTYMPETEIYVVSNACAGTTPEKHSMALEVMKSCQINVI